MPRPQHHGAKALTKKQQAAFPAIYKPREPLRIHTNKVHKGWHYVISDALAAEGKFDAWIWSGLPQFRETRIVTNTIEEAQAWVADVIRRPGFYWAAWDESCIPCCVPDDEIAFAEAI